MSNLLRAFVLMAGALAAQSSVVLQPAGGALPAATRGTPYSFTFTGNPPGTYTYTSNLPGGLGLTLSSDGLLSGTPTVSSSTPYTFNVTLYFSGVAVDTKSFTLQINEPLSITTTSPLPDATAGVPYSVTISASGGPPTSPFVWSFSPVFPRNGLSVTSSGATATISGTPTSTGLLYFLATVSRGSTSTERNFVLSINPAPLTITTSTLPPAVLNRLYSYTLSATGGVLPYTWSAVTPMPPGLSLTSAGEITGTPTVAGDHTFTVQVQDSEVPVGTYRTAAIATKTFTLSVIPTLSITTTSLPGGVVGRSYSTTLQSTGGTPSVTWTFATTPPAGWTLTPQGVLSGTPASTTPLAFSVLATDSGVGTARQTDQRTLTLTPVPELIITTTSLPSGIVGQLYTAAIATTGGTPPVTFALGPSSPAGWTLTPQGVLSGTPASTTPLSFAIEATDSGTGALQQIARRTLTVTPTAGLTITPATLPSAVVGTAYSTNLGSTGGIGAVTFSFALTPPPGWSLTPGGVLSGTPNSTAPLTFTVQASDSGGELQQTVQRTYTLTPVPALTITPTTLPAGIVGRPYSTTIGSTGGTGAVTFDLVGTQPAGWTLTPQGVLSGTPTSTTPLTFTVLATDSGVGTARQTDQRALTLTPIPALTIQTTTLSGAFVGEPYVATLQSSGGTGSVTWGFLGTAPAGWTLTPQGVLSGTPNSTAPLTFSVQATDSGVGNLRQTAQRTLTLAPQQRFLITTASPLASGTVGVPYALTFTATGGIPPYMNWRNINEAGGLPPGLTLNPSTGVLQGTPTRPGTYDFLIVVDDSQSGDGRNSAEKNFRMVVNDTILTITTASPLPPATRGEAYTQALVATAGTTPYTWSIVTGGLPPGLTLSAQGVISGTTTAPVATYSFTVRVRDSRAGDVGPRVAEKAFTLELRDAAFTILTTALPQAERGERYDALLAATGGIRPYTWSITSGALPRGLTLSQGGAISGIPAALGTANFTVQARDADGRLATRALSITVTEVDRPLSISVGDLPEGYVGRFYAATVVISGGQQPYTVTITGLPPGLRSEGTLVTGTPTRAGSFPVSVQVRDSLGTSASTTANLRIRASEVFVDPSLVSDGRVGERYTVQFAGAGGLPPYRFSTGDSIPGLSLNGDGLLSGTPEQVGSFTFTVTVRDANGQEGQRSYTLRIRPARLTITTLGLPDAAPGTRYSTTLAATGGTTPYSWSLASGSLPEGLTLSNDGTLAGTATAAGTYVFVVQVTDSQNEKDARELRLQVGGELTISGNLPSQVVIGQAIAATLETSGGVLPLTWTVTSGSAPAGLTFAGGTLSGAATATGVFNFTVRVQDATGRSASREFTIRAVAPLQITTETLPTATVGTPYTQTIGGTGGVGPYTFTGTGLPEPLTMGSDGTISGTPRAAGAITFTVTITDSSDPPRTITRTFTINVGLPNVSSIVLGGIPTAAGPQQQPSLSLTLGAPFPTDIQGTITLTFAPNAVSNADDPAVRFASGGRTATFTIPAGSTNAVFPNATALGLQTGTVAGVITLTTTLESGGTPVNCNCVLTQTITIPRSAPVITNVTANRTASGFNVVITGYTTTRELTQGTFRFTGPNVSTTDVTVQLGTAMQAYFGGAQSAGFGGQFRITMPFNTQGDPAGVTGVSLTVANTVGTSNQMSATF